MTAATQQRLFSEQVPEWQRFQVATTLAVAAAGSSGSYESAGGNAHHGYQRQYAHVYHQRLAVLGPLLLAPTKATAEDTSTQVVPRILELPEDVLVTCVGTLVREATDTTTATKPMQSTDYSYFLEDESGRVSVDFETVEDVGSTGDYDDDRAVMKKPLLLCTGLVLRLTGNVGADGVLRVQEIATAAAVMNATPAAVENSLPNNNSDQAVAAPHLLLLSGLECGSEKASSLPRDMLISYVQGLFGHSKAPAVAHIVLAGGLIAPTAMADGCRDLDGFVRQLTKLSGVPVTVLPGKDDPTTAQWPQRPFHSSLLPHSSSNGLLSRSPNPYAATFAVNSAQASDGEPNVENRERLVIGTDGTNVADFMLQTSITSELEALRQTLAHQHICPTGPDTVPTVPHAEKDPMVIASFSQQPSVYFCGNADTFSTQLVSVQHQGAISSNRNMSDSTTHAERSDCRLVCIPKFIETGTAVLVNLDTLAVELLKFDASVLK